eukprot:TRINITY_DN11_c0_g1_i2.p1 TRINITY_DN11_c0_g1~~TRINITY_DN11_c0_g1_i2.p1  ORF type:complete len:475 (+),score=186.79 TRINITY_DN11_c0_g1_i2:78-1427(+)
MRACLFAVVACAAAAQGGDVLGYLEDWVDVKWWDNNIPGNCLMGCFEPQPYIAAIKPYSSVNYGFTFLTENPTPSQVGCSNAPNASAPAGPCPAWDAKALYLAAAGKQGAAAITPTTTAATPGIVSIMEAGRMAKMHPDGPKRFKISLGGWSDFARLANADNAEGVARLAAQLVMWTFADGVDLDFEHLTEYSNIAGDDEFSAFAVLLKTLHTELATTVKNGWVAHAQAQQAQLQAAYDQLEPWQQAQAKPYYMTNINYCKEVAQNGPPQFEVSWTTRFNAFLPKDNRWNYLMPDSVVPNSTFATDYEGSRVYGASGQYIDTVNIMAYDAGAIKLNFTTILTNFVAYGGVPKDKIMIGFEPGEQAAGGIWEGMAYDKEVAQYVAQQGFAGAFVWAVNPSPQTNPQGTQLCPELAQALNGILKPTWHWGAAPTYTKCDATSGWGPNTTLH